MAQRSDREWLFSVADNGIGVARSSRSKSLGYSNVSTASHNTPAPVGASQFANGLLNVPLGEFGLNPNQAVVQRFSLASPSESSGSSASQSKIILLVEDNPADALLVREALREHGVQGQIVVVQDGEAAIQLAHSIDEIEDCPDLVIVDLNLPKRTGKEVLSALRATSKCRSVPIAILSSSDTRQDREDTARLGATCYLRKPSILNEFMALGGIFKSMANGDDAKQSGF